MTRIVAVCGALPNNCYSQSEITDAFAELCLPEGSDRRLLDRLHAGIIDHLGEVLTRHSGDWASDLYLYPAVPVVVPGWAVDAARETGAHAACPR